MGAVQAVRPARDAADQSEQRQARPHTLLLDEARRGRVAARPSAQVSPQPAHSAHSSRAIASYARVADDTDRHRLRDVLGFDGYA